MKNMWLILSDLITRFCLSLYIRLYISSVNTVAAHGYSNSNEAYCLQRVLHKK